MISLRLPRSARNGLSAAATSGLGLALMLAGCAQLPGAAPAAGGSSGTDVMNVADAAIAGNDPTMALKVSQSVLKTDPRNLDALYHEGAAYYAVNRCEDAVAAYKVALTIDPNSSEAETGIGRCLLKRDAAAAEQAFETAVADDASNAAALNDLGIARDLQGKYAAATDPYEKALLIQPGTQSTEVNLGMSLALSGDAQDALQYLGPLATGQDATPKIREDYAAALVAAGRTDEARQILSIDLAPNQVDAMLNDVSAAIASAQSSAASGASGASVATSQPVSTSAAVTPVAVTPVTAAPVDVAPVAAAPMANPPAASDTPETTAAPAPAAPAVVAPAPVVPAPAPASQSFTPDTAPSDQLAR